MTPTSESTTRMMSVCPRCKTPRSVDIEARTASEFFYLTSVQGGKSTPHVTCNGCGRGLHRWAQVNGKLNEAVKCNARCTSARRADCECSCAGHNHGSDNR